ncbi:MAG TPA: hypothetical protein G4O18_08045 [Dehalococcoidia bacterium]|nr:hypothetical protein [Dehalococcoidia bacterium]
MTKLFSSLRKGEEGVTLLIVLLMMTVGSLLIVPTLSFISTSIQTGEVFEEKVEALYAAEAGVEDALWRMANNKPSSFPYSYELTDINGMTVSVVINAVETIAGQDVGTGGVHDDYLIITKSVVYNDGIYDYTLSVNNDGTGNVKVEMILIDLPPGLGYVWDSTGGDLYGDNPAVIGDSSTGITLFWEFIPPYPTIPEEATRIHTFQLSSLTEISGAEGHGCVKATRQDVGTVWDSDSHPYSITAQAKDATDTVVSTIRTGFWEAGIISITCWQVNP